MRSFLAGLVQLRAGADTGAAIARGLELAREAAGRGAELVVLPENYWGIGPEDLRTEVVMDPEAPEASPAVAPFCALSRQSDAVLVLGGVPQRSSAGRVLNTLLVLHGGRIIARYHKIHRFDADLADGSRLRESATTDAGRDPIVVETHLGRLGLSICYDLRFPELYRALTSAGAEILLVPAAFTLWTGIDHWRPLLQARAIENQAFVLAAAQDGVHGGGRASFGHSMIVDPWGIPIAQAGPGEGVIVARLDPGAIARARSSLPCLSHRVLAEGVRATLVEPDGPTP